jgi:hypothetical protein
LGLAHEESAQPFSAAFVGQYDLSSPSSAQRAAEALVQKDLIDRDNGTFVVLDRFFQRWIVRQHGGRG